MDKAIILNGIIIVVLIALSAFFSATETAFSSINRIRIKNLANLGDKRAIKTMKISDDYDRALSAILIGNNIVNIASASLGTILFTKLIGDMGVGVSTLVMTVIVLMFGEILPKSLAKENAEKFALSVSGILMFLIKVLSPVIWVIIKIKSALTKKIVRDENQPSVTEEELKYILEEIEDEGILNERESELMQSALEFDDITVSKILTPRVDVVGADVTEDIDVIRDLFLEESYSRIPIYEKNIDNIIGVLNERDFIKAYIKNKNVDIRPLLQRTMFVPPKKSIYQLMKEIQKEKLHLAVVTDQYGGTLGIITLEDIIEELVGEIWDESDEVITEITKINTDTYRVNADINVFDLLEYFNIDESNIDEDTNTLSGVALDYFEKIPSNGDSFNFEGLNIIVENVIDQRITSFIIKFSE
ncbi:MAG: hemolysin family protein [Oscillospiraceae bacterium]